MRDRIPEIIKEKGENPVTHVANDNEYWEKLKDKLWEEVDEFSESSNEEELADIFEVINAICEFKGFDRQYLEKVRKKKVEERGAFKEKIILDKV